MIHHIFALYDSKAESYTRPFLCRTVGEAVRDFAYSVNDPAQKPSQYFGDFTLFQIGEYDDQTGGITQLKAHINLGNGADHKEKLNHG